MLKNSIEVKRKNHLDIYLKEKNNTHSIFKRAKCVLIVFFIIA